MSRLFCATGVMGVLVGNISDNSVTIILNICMGYTLNTLECALSRFVLITTVVRDCDECMYVFNPVTRLVLSVLCQFIRPVVSYGVVHNH